MAFSANSNARHSRHSSTASQYFDVAEDDPPPVSDSDVTAALILVHDEDDEEDENQSPLHFTDDEDERDNDEELVSPLFELRRSAVFPPLQPSLVFLYLLAPHLRLGALNIPYSSLPLKYALPALLLSASATAFTRQIWYMLARYIRKGSMTDIFLDTFARGRGNERRRLITRTMVKVSVGCLGVFLSIVYLRYSMYTLSPIFANVDHPGIFYGFTSVVVFFIVAYFSYARSLDYQRIVIATGLSVISYIAWLGCTIYAHSKGLLPPEGAWLGSGRVWPGLVSIVFAFCSSSTLSLYSSLKSASRPISGSKVPVWASFRFLSMISATLAVLLLLPSIIFASFPNHPAPSIQSPLIFSMLRDNITHYQNTSDHRPPPKIIIPAVKLHTVIRVLSASTLILSIPSILVSIPSLRIPSLRSAKFNVSRVIVIFIVMLCGLIPPPPLHELSGDSFLSVSGLYGSVILLTLFMAYMGTFFIPTLLHVSQHFFKRPLAIVVPRTQPTETSLESGNAGPSTSRLSLARVDDELLLRKERALQKKQFKKRIIWDVGVWALLLTSLAGLLGYSGYLVGTW